MNTGYKKQHDNWWIIVHSQDTIPEDSTRTDTNITPQQDTIVEQQDTIADTTHVVTYDQDSIRTTPVDSIKDTAVSEEKQLPPEQPSYSATTEEPPATTKFDTIAELYELLNVTELPLSKRLEKDPSTINFLYNIPVYAPKKNTEGKKVFLSSHTGQEIMDRTTQREIKIAERPSSDWITWILIGLFLLIGWSRLFFKKYFSLLFKSLFFLSYAEEIYHDKNPLTTRVSMGLNLNYFIILGIFGYQFYVFSGHEFLFLKNSVLIAGLFSAFFIAWYIWNAIFSGLVGSLFEVAETYNKYLYNYNLHRKAIGIIIFPLSVIIQYIIPEFREPLFKTGILLFGILYFIHIIRGLQIFIKDNVSIFHLILYLCALEFLPIIVLFDVLSD